MTTTTPSPAATDSLPPPPPPADRTTWRRVSRLFLPYRTGLAAILAAILVSSGLGIVTPFLTQAVFDRALFPADRQVDLRCSAGWCGDDRRPLIPPR